MFRAQNSWPLFEGCKKGVFEGCKKVFLRGAKKELLCVWYNGVWVEGCTISLMLKAELGWIGSGITMCIDVCSYMFGDMCRERERDGRIDVSSCICTVAEQ